MSVLTLCQCQLYVSVECMSALTLCQNLDCMSLLCRYSIDILMLCCQKKKKILSQVGCVSLKLVVLRSFWIKSKRRHLAGGAVAEMHSKHVVSIQCLQDLSTHVACEIRMSDILFEILCEIESVCASHTHCLHSLWHQHLHLQYLNHTFTISSRPVPYIRGSTDLISLINKTLNNY